MRDVAQSGRALDSVISQGRRFESYHPSPEIQQNGEWRFRPSLPKTAFGRKGFAMVDARKDEKTEMGTAGHL